MNDFEQINKDKIAQYRREAKIDNIYIIEAKKYKSKIIEHYLKLDKNDLFLRFNTFMTKTNIINYVNFLINKNATLVAYIINDEVQGLCEIIDSQDNIAEIAITVIKKYRKLKIGKHLLIHSVFLANKNSYELIKIDFSRNNKIVFSWTKGFNINITSDHSDCFTIFPTVEGNIDKLTHY